MTDRRVYGSYVCHYLKEQEKVDMSWILYPFIGLIVFLGCFIVYKARQKPNCLKIGTFIILTLTFIFLAIYTSDTHRLAQLTQERWERESILLATYAMAVTDNKGDKGRTGFLIRNPSNLILRAKVSCNFKVYNTPVDCDDAYNGKNIWNILPANTNQGWFEIESLLRKVGKTVQQMINEYSEENRDNQLTVDLKMEFRDESGNKRILPSMKYYFAFNDWKWIPIFAVKEDW
jgi:hypothetical protein